jgi:hypothetical protein
MREELQTIEFYGMNYSLEHSRGAIMNCTYTQKDCTGTLRDSFDSIV